MGTSNFYQIFILSFYVIYDIIFYKYIFIVQIFSKFIKMSKMFKLFCSYIIIECSIFIVEDLKFKTKILVNISYCNQKI